MDIECKQFARHIRNLDKEVRAWDAFTGLESTVMNTLTSLRAVAELQNPAIRDRHWKQLMQVTGVSFTMDQDTTLAHLLQLQLHHFEDQVQGIVDKAVKEIGMEKTLKELQTTWASMEFQYEPHPRTNVLLLRSDEDLIEVLEDNQVQLQNLMMSKYVSFFLEEVSSWQKKLSTADAVISIWFEVQRTWSHLESIFIGSEDIRAQLPQVLAEGILCCFLIQVEGRSPCLTVSEFLPFQPPCFGFTSEYLPQKLTLPATKILAEEKRGGKIHTNQFVLR
jgi:dynein heavy chain